jgi:hypothetical protein
MGKGGGVGGAEGIGPRNTAPLYRTRGRWPVASGHVCPPPLVPRVRSPPAGAPPLDHGHPFRALLPGLRSRAQGAPERTGRLNARPSPVQPTVLRP